MKKMFLSIGLSVLIAGYCSVTKGAESGVVDSKTTFAKDSVQKFMDSGEMPGAIAVYYDNGVQETACIG